MRASAYIISTLTTSDQPRNGFHLFTQVRPVREISDWLLGQGSTTILFLIFQSIKTHYGFFIADNLILQDSSGLQDSSQYSSRSQ